MTISQLLPNRPWSDSVLSNIASDYYHIKYLLAFFFCLSIIMKVSLSLVCLIIKRTIIRPVNKIWSATLIVATIKVKVAANFCPLLIMRVLCVCAFIGAMNWAIIDRAATKAILLFNSGVVGLNKTLVDYQAQDVFAFPPTKSKSKYFMFAYDKKIFGWRWWSGNFVEILSLLREVTSVKVYFRIVLKMRINFFFI